MQLFHCTAITPMEPETKVCSISLVLMLYILLTFLFIKQQ